MPNAKLLSITRWLSNLQLPTAGEDGKLCIFIKPIEWILHRSTSTIWRGKDAAGEDTGYEKDAWLVFQVRYSAPAKGRLKRKAVNFRIGVTQLHNFSTFFRMIYAAEEDTAWEKDTQHKTVLSFHLCCSKSRWLRGGVKSKQIMATKISHFVVLAFLFNPDCQKRLE